MTHGVYNYCTTLSGLTSTSLTQDRGQEVLNGLVSSSALFFSCFTSNTHYACLYLLTILVYLPYLSHSRRDKVKKRIHWDLHLYKTTTTCNYRFLRRPRDSKLSVLDEVVAVFHLTTPQFLALHPPLVNSRSLMAQLAATKTIQRFLKLLKWNAKTNGKRTSRISALDRNQDLDGRRHGLWRRCRGEISPLPQSACGSCILIAGCPIMSPRCSLTRAQWSYCEGDSQLQTNTL